ncbi:hypothetical protein NMG60_11008109 [Bertholletia excelsa]
MAKTILVCACAFVLVLVLCNEVARVEGRHLKWGHCRGKKNDNMKAKVAGIDKLSGYESMERRRKMEHLEDFRPTTPGHSPGVGHSIHD